MATPLALTARTVTVVTPVARPVSDTREPVIATPTRFGSPAPAVYDVTVPVKAYETSNSTGGSPTYSTRFGRSDENFGAPRSMTVTRNDWNTEPLLFLALTDTVVTPSASGASVSFEPATIAVTMPGLAASAR